MTAFRVGLLDQSFWHEGCRTVSQKTVLVLAAAAVRDDDVGTEPLVKITRLDLNIPELQREDLARVN
jgi:hypothetical protein